MHLPPSSLSASPIYPKNECNGGNNLPCHLNTPFLYIRRLGVSQDLHQPDASDLSHSVVFPLFSLFHISSRLLYYYLGLSFEHLIIIIIVLQHDTSSSSCLLLPPPLLAVTKWCKGTVYYDGYETCRRHGIDSDTCHIILYRISD